jgi:alpha-mannosidase
MGLAMHRAREVKLDALNRLVAKIDTTVPPPRSSDVATDVPVVLWNPLPRPFVGLAEAEVQLDWRPIWKFRDRPAEMPVVVFDHEGKPMPFQIVDTEHTAMVDVPWRRRVVAPVEIPALGWTLLRVGWREEPEAKTPEPECRAERDGAMLRIRNAEWSVAAAEGTVSIRRKGRNFLSGNRNLEIRVVEDTGGSWGGASDKMENAQVLETWRIEQSEILEHGPLRAKLWTRWKGRNSWLDLTFILAAGSPELRVAGRMLWNERSARVKLVLPCKGEMEYDMPGGRIAREVKGQVPAARWAARSGPGKMVGIASDVLSDFDATPDELRVTLARAARYANSGNTLAKEKVWQPVVDCGELKFQLCLFGENAEPDHVADALLFAPSAIIAPRSPGPWSRKGSLGSLSPASMRLLTIEQCAPGELKVRVQNRARISSQAVLKLGGASIRLGKFGPEQIKTFLLRKQGKAPGKYGVKQVSA